MEKVQVLIFQSIHIQWGPPYRFLFRGLPKSLFRKIGGWWQPGIINCFPTLELIFAINWMLKINYPVKCTIVNKRNIFLRSQGLQSFYDSVGRFVKQQTAPITLSFVVEKIIFHWGPSLCGFLLNIFLYPSKLTIDNRQYKNQHKPLMSKFRHMRQY